MGFRDWDNPRGPISLTRRGVDEAGIVSSTCLCDIQRAADVGLHVRVGRLIAVGNADECAQMKHSVATSDRIDELAAIAQVTGPHRNR